MSNFIQGGQIQKFSREFNFGLYWTDITPTIHTAKIKISALKINCVDEQSYISCIHALIYTVISVYKVHLKDFCILCSLFLNKKMKMRRKTFIHT
jgi:hypothetical protein